LKYKPVFSLTFFFLFFTLSDIYCESLRFGCCVE